MVAKRMFCCCAGVSVTLLATTDDGGGDPESAGEQPAKIPTTMVDAQAAVSWRSALPFTIRLPSNPRGSTIHRRVPGTMQPNRRSDWPAPG